MTDVMTLPRVGEGPRQGDPTGGECPPELAGTVAEALVLVVAPSTGRFRPSELGPEEDGHGDPALEGGAVLGHVTGGGGRADPVRAPVHAGLRRWLARPGQLVVRGQALAWLGRAGPEAHAEGHVPAGKAAAADGAQA